MRKIKKSNLVKVIAFFSVTNAIYRKRSKFEKKKEMSSPHRMLSSLRYLVCNIEHTLTRNGKTQDGFIEYPEEGNTEDSIHGRKETKSPNGFNK